MSSFIPKDGALYNMFLNSKQARLSMAAHAVIIAIMLVGTVLTRSTSLLAITLTLIIAMLLTAYKINCMVVGDCTTWAWIEAGFASLSVVVWVITLMRVLQSGGTIEGAAKAVSGGRRRA